VQIGDPGYCTYTSLFAQPQDAILLVGLRLGCSYNNTRSMMSRRKSAIDPRLRGLRGTRRDAGADGSSHRHQGYLIHQFLNPGINRRSDAWGGDPDKRFRFLQHVVEAIRERIGRDFLFGIRLSAEDRNYSPPVLALLRLPWPTTRERWAGNEQRQMLAYAKRLKDLHVDYLHVVSGWISQSARRAGPFPYDEIKMFFNSTRHLTRKAAIRATLASLLPDAFGRWLFNIGWKYEQGINLDAAEAFRDAIGLPVIASGGFRTGTSSRAPSAPAAATWCRWRVR
jgi:2,4-dienoyl-CoA reductase (NADPH2)